jgi:hypothetical protein
MVLRQLLLDAETFGLRSRMCSGKWGPSDIGDRQKALE